MTNREYFIKRWEEESSTFLKVFRALPQDKPEYRPHPISRTAAALVWLLVLEEQACVAWAQGKDVEWKETPPPKSLEEIIAAYEQAHTDFEVGLKKLNDEIWENKKVRLKVRVEPGFYELPLGEMLWAVMFDAIHHRGQLSLYIRLSGGKVPPIYGSSADEKIA